MNAGRDIPGDASPSAPVFLVGSERSGTTLLRLMLDHHPEIAFDKEFDYAVTMVSDTGVRPPTRAYRSWVVTVRGMKYEVNPSLAYQQLVNDFLRQKRVASGGKPCVGATIHRNFDRSRFLWPEATYIHLVRDPRDVARSVVQKEWAGNVYQAAEYWLDAERCWESLAGHLSEDQAIEVRYENLVTDAETVLSAICGFMGLRYSPAMLEYSADAPQYPAPDPSLVAQWRTAMAPRDIALVEIRTGPLLQRRGYVRSGYPWPRVGRSRHEPASRRRPPPAAAIAGAHVRRGGGRVLDTIGRRASLPRVERYARVRMNAIEQRMVDQESMGLRGPSANIAPPSGAVDGPATYRRRSGTKRLRDGRGTTVSALRASGQAFAGRQSRNRAFARVPAPADPDSELVRGVA